jgi:Arylsulfotransferase (ASST)
VKDGVGGARPAPEGPKDEAMGTPHPGRHVAGVDRDPAAGARLSRRTLLARLALGSAAAGAAAVLGYIVVEEATRGEQTTTVTGPLEDLAVPELASAASTATAGAAQVFRSRPDLSPPTISVNVRSDQFGPHLVLTDSHAGPAQQGPMIIDGNGDLVWFLPLSRGNDTGLRAFNLQTWTYKGKPVLGWFQGAVVEAHGQGHYVLFDSSYKKVADVFAKNGYLGDLHDFVVTPQGTALFTCYGQARADLSRYGGPRKGTYFYGVVQEVDLSTGKLVFEWRSDDHIGLDESYKPALPNSAWDYFHLNSVDVDQADGNLIISGRNTWAFYKVQRPGGKVLWRLGGKQTSFKLGAGAQFAFQHDVRRHADGTYTLFDNEGGPPAEAAQSRGVVLSVDEKSLRANLVRQYLHSPPVLSEALGSVQDMYGENRFIGWGESSYFTEYGPSGQTIFDARLAPGTESYRAFKQAWRGIPSEPPSIAVDSGDSGATVYASWNGATEVARWLVLGGASHAQLRPLGRAPRQGFETAITVPHPPNFLAVEALTVNGASLARSQPQPLP